MDNIISGIVAVTLVTLFLGGLAISIGSVPFGIITIVVLSMTAVDFVESVRDSLGNKQDK